MAEQRPEELLQRLDELLAANPCTPCYGEDMNDEDYQMQHKLFHQLDSPHFNSKVSFISETACLMLESMRNRISDQPFRLCSIGCGYGMTDMQILLKILERYPDHKLQYVGVDINEFSCRTARGLLQPLENVEAQLIAADIQELDVDKIQQMDFVFSIHSLMYMTSMDKGLTASLKLLKPSGQMAIISTPRTPLFEPCARFWLHEYKRPYLFTSDVTSSLDRMDVSYTMETPSNIQLDLTQCFREGFLNPPHKTVLDFICQTKMSQYPASVAQTAVDFLHSIMQGKPERYAIDRVVDWLVVKHSPSAE